ncbi:hypothetical protein G9C85_00860 [Halorubellus sp. JP-L1]|uniref:hypothetical protein n=1 Tax=Halorubellus sp. JP-L1 TaxID=2715753 RepID=UPI0014090904|nr:hypothetical protein [Halorubellus sp. JP-L1]NHN40185.1 hypothetical protein [Halorubellus sp. JP-L1]
MTTAVDAALAFAGIVAIVFPITALADAVLGSPLGRGVLFASFAAGALGAAGFVTTDRSLTRLAKFLGFSFASGFGWLVVVAAVMTAFGVAIPAGDRRPFLYAGLLALATGYTFVYGDAVDATFESGDPSSFGSES